MVLSVFKHVFTLCLFPIVFPYVYPLKKSKHTAKVPPSTPQVSHKHPTKRGQKRFNQIFPPGFVRQLDRQPSEKQINNIRKNSLKLLAKKQKLQENQTEITRGQNNNDQLRTE